MVTPSSDRYYNFVIPAGSTAAELSIVLAWNVQVTDTNSVLFFRDQVAGQSRSGPL